MKEYDVIVIGSGAGLSLVENALDHGFSVALVDKGPLGGTCLNLGCIPSKMLIYPSDLVAEIVEAGKLGVTAGIKDIDFPFVMKRMRQTVKRGAGHVREGIRGAEALDFYEGEAHFVKDYTLEVGGERIKGEKIFICSGARPSLPPIKGIDSVDFLTNETVLALERRPESIAIVGGGYIAAEYAHFFAGMGSRVTVLQRNSRLVPEEEPEISELLRTTLSRRMEVRTNTEVTEIGKSGDGYTLIGKERTSQKEIEVTAGQVLVAAGRASNADLLKVGNTGVRTDDRNYVVVNEYLETTKKNIWAIGDAVGRKMFRHVANREAAVVWDNAVHEAGEKMDYSAAPHAVFSRPEIASVGLTEQEAGRQHRLHELLVGKAKYREVARGEAMAEEEGFAKAIVKRSTGKIIGFHIAGPSASILIHEVIVAMANDLDMWQLGKAMHIHPALSELIIATLGNLQEVE
ncbi:MAG: dihydrolipoyl dehydrogenase [Nitrospirae bacterium]|nr:dihydrolipoyl dehydrogenase [Nitrospirota bacterium]